jgi:hypothetical protein
LLLCLSYLRADEVVNNPYLLLVWIETAIELTGFQGIVNRVNIYA